MPIPLEVLRRVERIYTHANCPDGHVPPVAVKVFDPGDKDREGTLGDEVYQRSGKNASELAEVLKGMGAMLSGRVGGPISGTVFLLIRKG